MDFDFGPEEGKMVLDYDKLISDKSLLRTTRLVAAEIKAKGYINVSEFFNDIDEDDLQTLIGYYEDPNTESFMEVLILAEMLALGEGLENSLFVGDEDAVIEKRIKMLMSLLVCESLARKGLIKLHRQNMSFGDDMADKIIAERYDD